MTEEIEKVTKATLELEVEGEVLARLGVPLYAHKIQTIFLWTAGTVSYYRFNLWRVNEEGYVISIPHTFFISYSRHDGFISANPPINFAYKVPIIGKTGYIDNEIDAFIANKA